jgi:hypothetical protein
MTTVLARRLARLEELAVPSTAAIEDLLAAAAADVHRALHALAAGMPLSADEDGALDALFEAMEGVPGEAVCRALQPVMAGLDLAELRALALPASDDAHDEAIVWSGKVR